MLSGLVLTENENKPESKEPLYGMHAISCVVSSGTGIQRLKLVLAQIRRDD